MTLTRRLMAIGAIARRDVVVMLGYRVQFLLQTIGTLTVVITLYFISKIVAPDPRLGPYGGNYFGFSLVGICVLTFANFGVNGLTATLSNEQNVGTLEILLAGPVGLSTLLAGMAVVPAAIAVLSTAIYLLVGVLLGVHLTAAGILPAVVLTVLLMAVFYAFGLASAALLLVVKRGNAVGLVVMQATTVLAGAVFPVQVLPPTLAGLAHVFPAFYGLDGLRKALLTHASWSGSAADIAIMAAWAAVLLPVGRLLSLGALRHARRAGTLGTY